MISRLRACGDYYSQNQFTWFLLKISKRANGRWVTQGCSALRLLYLRGASARGIEVEEGFVTYENLSFDYTKLLLECPSIGKVLCLVEAEFLLRFLLCMMLQELREAIQTYLARGDSNSLCRGRHNRGFSVFIPFQVCAFLLRAWCCRSYAKRSRQLSEHTKKEFQEVFFFAELSSKGCH